MEFQEDDPVSIGLLDAAMFLIGSVIAYLVSAGISHIMDLLRVEWPAVCAGLTLAAECSARIVEGGGM